LPTIASNKTSIDTSAYLFLYSARGTPSTVASQVSSAMYRRLALLALLLLQISLHIKSTDALLALSTHRSTLRSTYLHRPILPSSHSFLRATINDDEPFDNTLDALQEVNKNFKLFLRSIPTPILTAASFIGTTVFVWELSKLAFITAVPLILILGTLITLTFIGGFFAALVLSGLLLFYLPMVLSLIAAINLSSFLILGISYVVSTLAIQVLMMDKKQIKKSTDKKNVFETTAIDTDTDSAEQARLNEFDRKLDDTRRK
jgi:hypothetical protein